MKRHTVYAAALVAVVSLSSCANAVRFSSDTRPPEQRPGHTGNDTPPVQNGATFRGIASYYADKFHGRVTSSGEVYNMNDLTAAHRTLPFGTTVEVRNLRNNRTVTVRINDRGPQKTERIIDLSKAAAEYIDMTRAGLVEVEVRVLN